MMMMMTLTVACRPRQAGKAGQGEAGQAGGRASTARNEFEDASGDGQQPGCWLHSDPAHGGLLNARDGTGGAHRPSLADY